MTKDHIMPLPQHFFLAIRFCDKAKEPISDVEVGHVNLVAFGLGFDNKPKTERDVIFYNNEETENGYMRLTDD